MAVATHRAVFWGIAILLVSIAYPFWRCQTDLAAVSELSDVKSTGASIDIPHFQNLIARLDRQKDQRSTWAYGALGAVIAITVVKKVFAIPWVRWAYFLLAIAGVYLLESIRAGDMYEQRLAYLVTLPTIRDSDIASISGFLWLQVDFLNSAVYSLMLFVAAFLIAIVSGKATMETKSND